MINSYGLNFTGLYVNEIRSVSVSFLEPKNL